MFESIKKKIFKKDDVTMIASFPCKCKGLCNRGLYLLQHTDDDDALEVVIDWRISNQPPRENDNSITVLVSRKELMENIIRSGKPLLRSAEFQYALDKYFADFNAEKTNTLEVKLPSEVTVDEFMEFIKNKVKKDYEEYKD